MKEENFECRGDGVEVESGRGRSSLPAGQCGHGGGVGPGLVLRQCHEEVM